MNEAQTRLDKIDPKLRDAGWGIVPGSKIHSGTVPFVYSSLLSVISVTQFATHAQNRGGCFVFYLYNSRLAC